MPGALDLRRRFFAEGYYGAMIARCVGLTGHVSAIEASSDCWLHGAGFCLGA